MPIDVPAAPPLPAGSASAEVRVAWAHLFGEQTVLTDGAGGRVVLSDRVVEHWLEASAERLDGRERFLPLLREIIEEPAEIWTDWLVDVAGRYELRRRFVKLMALGEGTTAELVAEATAGGVWLRLAFGKKAIEEVRRGLLVWRRMP